MFTDVEEVRSTIRYYRGRVGTADRIKLTDKRFELPAPSINNPFSMPTADKYVYKDFHIPASIERVLVIADTHIPYHDMKMLTAVMAQAKRWKPDCIIINGDLFDFYYESVFVQEPGKAWLAEELDKGRQFLTMLRVNFPDALIVWKLGNHDDRFKLYTWRKAPQFAGIPETRLDVVLGLPNLGIQYVPDKQIVRCGKLSIIHGHEFAQSLTNPVNPARGLFLRAKSSSMCAHHHQTSEHTEPNIKDEIITCWSLGCCCQLHPQFMPINKWNHGFAEIEKTPNGNYQVDNYRVIDGVIM